VEKALVVSYYPEASVLPRKAKRFHKNKNVFP
jgi:hypothetical protein